MTANVPEGAGPHRDDAQPGTPFLTRLRLTGWSDGARKLPVRLGEEHPVRGLAVRFGQVCEEPCASSGDDPRVPAGTSVGQATRPRLVSGAGSGPDLVDVHGPRLRTCYGAAAQDFVRCSCRLWYEDDVGSDDFVAEIQHVVRIRTGGRNARSNLDVLTGIRWSNAPQEGADLTRDRPIARRTGSQRRPRRVRGDRACPDGWRVPTEHRDPRRRGRCARCRPGHVHHGVAADPSRA